ncbi:UPF0171-domain-containing protein [Neoconidiobolus thromboides FSU 785]|nr:UPF0171-domain-containing protein [Neoconidiobolus thromboides FSU 785]
MNTLQAIILVVNSSRGHHFVLQYPNSISKTETPNPNSVQHVETFHSSDLKPENNLDLSNHNHNDPRGIIDRKLQLYDTVLGFDPSLIANVFSPKSGLCNKRFQLTIQDLCFIGLPTLLENKNNKKNQSKDSKQFIPAGEENTVQEPYRTLIRTDSSNYSQITLFHMVYVVKNSSNSVYNSYQNFEDSLYNNVITTYNTALIYEQKRCDYLRQNVEMILSLTDEAISKGQSRDELMNNILNSSPLAKDIACLYSSICQGKIAQLAVNNYIHLSLQIPPQRLDFLTQHIRQDESSGNYKYPVIRPYHTLLLLDTPEDILKALPPDASPKIIKLIHVLTPTKSLSDLLPQLDCSMSHMIRLASHLIYWKKAKLIDVISPKNIYTLSPKFLNDFSYEDLVAEFKQYFPNIPLADLLSFLSTANQYALVSKDRELRAQYLEAIIFLLRKDAAVQLNHYIYLVIPRHIKLGYSSHEIDRVGVNWEGLPHQPGELSQENGYIPSSIALISNPAHATEAEKEWIKEVASSQVSELTHIFLRLVKYFNGQYHLDEIAYYENISKKDLILILNKYRGDIIAVLHYSDPMMEINSIFE